MEFTNNGGPVKVRIGEPSDCYWSTIQNGESIDLPRSVGLALGLTIKTTEGKLGDRTVQTKQIEAPDWFKELCSIDGIGKKTAEDIILIFPDREYLKNKIQNNEKLPVRDDTEAKLREKYGS